MNQLVRALQLEIDRRAGSRGVARTQPPPERPQFGAMLPSLVFIHIGKTAGTSLRLLLKDAFGEEACSEPFVQNRMTVDEARHYNSFRAICGHISRADQQKWFPGRRVITVLREPVDRCLSFIHYVRSLPLESAVVAADSQRMPVLEFLETEEAQRNTFNTMVRQLGGHMLDAPTDLPRLLEAAKQTLRDAFWVGRQDTIDDDLARLGRKIGVRLAPRHDNVTPKRPSYDNEPPELIDRLHALNGYDMQLWRWAERELFGTPSSVSEPAMSSLVA